MPVDSILDIGLTDSFQKPCRYTGSRYFRLCPIYKKKDAIAMSSVASDSILKSHKCTQILSKDARSDRSLSKIQSNPGSSVYFHRKVKIEDTYIDCLIQDDTIFVDCNEFLHLAGIVKTITRIGYKTIDKKLQSAGLVPLNSWINTQCVGGSYTGSSTYAC